MLVILYDSSVSTCELYIFVNIVIHFSAFFRLAMFDKFNRLIRFNDYNLIAIIVREDAKQLGSMFFFSPTLGQCRGNMIFIRPRGTKKNPEKFI